MKKVILIVSLFFFAIGSLYSQEQEPATEAGEDFDLNAVMEVLENAEDLGDFEKKINDEKNQVTNLDLDENDQVDFIKVVEYDKENTRLLVLQAVLKDNEFQDIATIEIEKHSEEEISLQVVGDPDIYGPDYILEPAPDDSSGDSGGGDCFSCLPEIPEYVSLAVFVSVHRWRPIRPLFRVGRAVFISSIVQDPLLAWFIIRRPIARATWRGRTRRYRKNRYRSTRNRHSKRGRNMYSNKRKTSKVAKNNFGPKATPAKSYSKSPAKANQKTSNNASKKATTSKKNNDPSNNSTTKNSGPKKSSPKGGSTKNKTVPRR